MQAAELEHLLSQDAWMRRLAARLVADESAAEDCAAQRIECADPRFSTLVPGTAQGHWIVVAAPRCSFAGVLLDPDGLPVAGAQLSYHLKLERSLVEAGLGSGDVHPGRWELESDSAGRFALRDAGGGRCLEVRARGFAPTAIDLPEESTSDLVVTLARDTRALVLTGVVLDPAGRPVERAWVSAGLALERTLSDGSFELRWPGGLEPFRAELAHTLAEHGYERASLIAVAPGRLPASRPLDELDLGAPVELHLGAEAMKIRGRVWDAEGQPVSDCLVWFEDPTHFGYEEFFSDARAGEVELHRSRVFQAQLVEQEVRGGLSAGRIRTAPDGSFELDGLLACAYWLQASDPRTGLEAGPVSVEAGRADVELALAGETSSTRIAGRVLCQAGEPIAGVEITPYLGTSGPEWFTGRHRAVVRTDTDGNFEFQRTAARATWLGLGHPRLFWPTFSLAGALDLEHLEIVVPLLCELQVDLSDGTALPNNAVLESASVLKLTTSSRESGRDGLFYRGGSSSHEASSVEFLDDDGAHLDALISPLNDEENVVLDPERTVAYQRFAAEHGKSPGSEPGPSWSVDERVSLRSGLSPIVWVKETARTLVVYRDGVEVARFPIRLDPYRRTILTP